MRQAAAEPTDPARRVSETQKTLWAYQCHGTIKKASNPTTQ